MGSNLLKSSTYLTYIMTKNNSWSFLKGILVMTAKDKRTRQSKLTNQSIEVD